MGLGKLGNGARRMEGSLRIAGIQNKAGFQDSQLVFSLKISLKRIFLQGNQGNRSLENIAKCSGFLPFFAYEYFSLYAHTNILFSVSILPLRQRFEKCIKLKIFAQGSGHFTGCTSACVCLWKFICNL